MEKNGQRAEWTSPKQIHSATNKVSTTCGSGWLDLADGLEADIRAVAMNIGYDQPAATAAGTDKGFWSFKGVTAITGTSLNPLEVG